MEHIENNNIRLPLIGLGTFGMHGDQLRIVISDALQLGYGLFDTATKYANEEDLGSATMNARNTLLQSKVHAIQLLGNLRYLRINRKTIKKSFELSSKRLGKAPEVYLLHSAFAGYEIFYKKLVELRERGLVKAIGICNIGLEQLNNLENKTGLIPDIIQVEIHPYHSNQVLIDFCQKHGILVEARSPLAHGDVMQDWCSNSVLLGIASKYSKSVPQIILRWITQQHVIAIVRSSKREHLKDNINIFDFNLTENEMESINSLNKNISFGFVSSKNNFHE